LKTHPAFAVLAAALLYACSSVEQPAPQDEELQRSLSAARSAYLQGQPELAANLYHEALERARERDDRKALAEISHDLGAAQLQNDDAEAALATARAALEEMEPGAYGAAPLRLVEAVALYRLGQAGEASAAARRVVSDVQADPVVRARAVFVEGLIAAEAGDVRTVEESLSRLNVPDEQLPDQQLSDQQPELAVDRIELTGWRALLVGDLQQARDAFGAAADGRRLALDYRGMRRALAAAGDAAAQQRDFADAADLYLRAGRSAAVRGESGQARLWLGRAEALADRARKPDLLDQARAWLDEIGE
jgi:tetratricopeptide (TPR) repeat protein